MKLISGKSTKVSFLDSFHSIWNNDSSSPVRISVPPSAFASQAVMSVDTLGLDYAKVNPSGGAIALGHPLGVSATSIVFFYPK
jgi:hypothetical protein